MTRKALRKRLRTQAKQTSRARVPRVTSPWMTVGVLVASAALTTARPTTASAAELQVRGGGVSAGRRQQLVRTLDRLPEFPDPRRRTFTSGSRHLSCRATDC